MGEIFKEGTHKKNYRAPCWRRGIGWTEGCCGRMRVNTSREWGKNTFVFLEVNDGSFPTNRQIGGRDKQAAAISNSPSLSLCTVQVLVDCSVASDSHLTTTGTCIMVEGELKQPPEGTKKRVELMVDKILEVGTVEPKYPISKTKLSMEHLRGFMHLRTRTNTVWMPISIYKICL